MKWVRSDVSEVPLQGGYVAKQCPVRAQWDVLQPVEPAPPSQAVRRRMDDGIRFEADVVAELVALHPGAVVVEASGPEDRARRERRTQQAMDDGASLIVGGRLPADPGERRVGEPDLLVAAPGGGYHPVDVKHHRSRSDKRELPARFAELSAPAAADARELDGTWGRKHKGDLFQLAHYRRMLEACGRAATRNLGGIVGTEREVTWYDLDAPAWLTPSVSEGEKVRSTMEVYDFEYAFRLDVIAVSRQHVADPSVGLLVVPVRTSECSECPWWHHCEPLLESVSDVSLLPYSGWRPWSAHRDRGVHTLEDLAGLDHRTAALLDGRVDVAGLLAAAEGAPPGASVGDVLGDGAVGDQAAAALDEAGVRTVDDVRALDPRVAAYTGARMRNFAESIDLARARVADAPVHLRRGCPGVEVRRADVEVDLDLENDSSGAVYLWGALVTDRSGQGLAADGYQGFVTWDPDARGSEVATFRRMCDWLSSLRRSTHEAGRTFAVYCFNEWVEAGAMRRLAALDADPGRPQWVDELVASADWVDLLRVARRHLISGRSMGLKTLAPLAGFAWEDEDPGGEQSMHWHELAVADPDPLVRRANRERVLTYNRNDVEATKALREWMEQAGPTLPRIDDLDAAYGWSSHRSRASAPILP